MKQEGGYNPALQEDRIVEPVYNCAPVHTWLFWLDSAAGPRFFGAHRGTDPQLNDSNGPWAGLGAGSLAQLWEICILEAPGPQACLELGGICACGLDRHMVRSTATAAPDHSPGVWLVMGLSIPDSLMDSMHASIDVDSFYVHPTLDGIL